MTDGDIPRGPVTNEFLLLEAVNGYVYSLIFWLPSKVGLPVPPQIFVREAFGTGVPLLQFPSGRGSFA